MKVLIILGVLFVALIVIVPLLERSNFRVSGDQMSKMGRWILPLLLIMVTVQLVMYWVGS
ncbi:MAG: hypothetical protein ACI9C4_002628 [Paraglaciecola sp.]|jgi:hypothetical protein